MRTGTGTAPWRAVPSILAGLPLALPLLFVLAGCERAGPASPTFPSLPDAGVTAPLPQHASLVVDGAPFELATDGVASPAIEARIDEGGTRLVVTLRDPAADRALVLQLKVARLEAGRWTAGACDREAPRCAARGSRLAMGRADLDADPARAPWQAVDAPAQGLAPASVDIERVEDVVQPGAGPARRIVATLHGTLHAVERGRVGTAVREVDGRLDVVAPLR